MLARNLLAFSWGMLLWGMTSALSAAPPHIVLILADDLAWSDVGCYGHPWHDTPHIDSLAKQGMKFTRGYAPAPICSASRASILTGKTTARLKFEFVTKNEAGFQQIEGETKLTTPPFTLNLPLKEQTIPEHLNRLGYQTAFFGKWHLNSHHKRYLGWSPTHGPKAQGFQIAEQDFGSHPYSWGKQRPEPIQQQGQYPDDSMIDRASNFLKQQHEQPFFLMVSMFHVHTPVKTECEWLIEKYEQKVPQNSPARNRRIAYAAFVETLDHYVGNILSAVDDAGLAEETLVVFLSDNGGHPEYTTNSPLRGSKWNLYEGGIRVPFLMRWLGQIEPGSQSETPVIGYDLLPTFVKLAGGAADNVDGNKNQGNKIDGIDISPLFKNSEQTFDRSLIWHFPYYHPERGYKHAIDEIGIGDFAVSKTHPHSAIMHGDHKLLYFYEEPREELYDLSNDHGEQSSLSESQSILSNNLRIHLLQHLRQQQARYPSEKEED